MRDMILQAHPEEAYITKKLVLASPPGEHKRIRNEAFHGVSESVLFTENQSPARKVALGFLASVSGNMVS